MSWIFNRPVSFSPLDPRSAGAWRKPRRYGFLEAAIAAPIADTELLQMAHYLPIALIERGGCYEVACVLHRDWLARPALRADGRWTPPYTPIALRAFPLRAVAGAPAAQRLAVAAYDGGDDAIETPFFRDGAPSEEFAALAAHLDRLSAGQAKLAAAASALAAADLIAPLSSDLLANAPEGSPRLFAVDPLRMRALSPARVAALAADGFLALDLAAACCFANRLWSPRLAMDRTGLDNEARLAARPFEFDQLAPLGLGIDLKLDESPLFTIDSFLARREAAEAG